ncbi:MAG: non-homologous end-joining DNA ligase [Acidimicrobiales bacterium]
MKQGSDALDALDAAERRLLRPAAHPAWVAPMLATLTDRAFSDPAWLYERKLDGERCLAFKHGEEVRLLSRSRRPLDATYPELVDAISDQSADDVVVDGEVVAFADGRTSFARLQQRLGISDAERARRSPVRVHYYLFDVVHLAGHDVTALPLRARKALLRRAVRFDEPIRYTPHRYEHGEDLLTHACVRGWEGLIAKRAESAYVSRRTSAWLKLKCAAEQELVVGGFTEPSGTRIGLGALLVGYYEDGDLRYAGKVGTGYSGAVLRDLRRLLDALERTSSPFRGTVREHGAHWVEPQLVAQIAFSEWTTEGKLRHPRFVGVRTDKPASEVRRELPQARPRA